MPKFFVMSDIHSYYDEMIEALNAAGYDENNNDHWIIVCGDLFDRGPKPCEMLKFFEDRARTILIRGNHEDLLEECCYRGFPYAHDESNGTYTTINVLGDDGSWTLPFSIRCANTLQKTRWLRHCMYNYFETKNYIFVHGWIPVIVNDKLPNYYARNRKFEYDLAWRYAHSHQWDQARWINGVDAARNGLNETGKTIVFGHWHCSYGHELDEGTPSFGEGANFNPWYGENAIGIDACTAASHKVNVLVIEDEFLEDEWKDGGEYIYED